MRSEGPARVPASERVVEQQGPISLVSEGFAVKVRLSGIGGTLVAAENGLGDSNEARSNLEKQEQVLLMLGTAQGKEVAAKALVEGMLTTGSRATKAGKLRTLVRFAGTAGYDLFPLTAEKLNPILGAMKVAGYRSADSYLHEARQRHVQLRHPISEDLKLYFKDAVRAIIRGRGPARRAPIVRLEELVDAGTPSSWKEQDSTSSGPAAPWDVFLVACWWMLRGAEVLALKTSQCTVATGERSRAEVRLGITKMDIEGVGRRRCFLCICPTDGAGDLLCPACALARLLRRGEGSDARGIGKLVRGPGDGLVTHFGLCRAWRRMLADVPRFDDAGKQVEAEITEHTARRTGAQFHARRGLALWQIQYIGRWGGPTVEIYVGEAFAEIRAGWADGDGQRAGPKRARQDEREDLQLWEVTEQLRRLSAAVADVRSYQEELSRFKGASNAFPEALCDEAVAEGLADEATSAGMFAITHETVDRFLAVQTNVCVVNCRSCVLHAIDLGSMASSTASTWSAACGWRFGAADGILAGATCTKGACAAKFEIMLAGDGEYAEEDDEAED